MDFTKCKHGYGPRDTCPACDSGEHGSELADTPCAADLSWTDDKPKLEGWYWLRYGDSYGWWEGCVEYDTVDNSVFLEGEWKEVEKVSPNAEWSDRPITEPINK